MDHFTQSAYIFLDRPLTADKVHIALSDRGVSITRHEAGTDLLTAATASVVLEVTFQPQEQVSVLVDSMNCPWPDRVLKKDPVLFVSWHAGAFGRFVYPGCLERALQECRTWPGAKKAAERHTALLRLRVTHKKDPKALWESGGAEKNRHLFEELVFLTRLLVALDGLPGVLGYFFPGGEALCSREMLVEIWKYYTDNGCRPFDLWVMWTNRRLGRTPEEPDWAMIDVVGLHQVGTTDLEACFQHAHYQPIQMANWLLNIGSYLYENGPIIEDGHTLTGPGSINWQAHNYESSLQFPPRPVLCLRPLDGTRLPRRFMTRLSALSKE
jgi:hypothetical protein